MPFHYENLKSPAYFAENRVPAHSDHVAFASLVFTPLLTRIAA